ncbi:MAG TPA: sulfurtransferase [Actinobacteria bacterium]|jgi:thiosulfate/3-mercaptopyruvate sulfurtransferase|nr:sulfurtransferase [Actinomycetota bacterium]
MGLGKGAEEGGPAPFHTLISVAEFHEHRDATWVVIDARHDLHDPRAGHAGYESGHIPGAIFAHLDRDLTGIRVPGETGRRPLPEAGDLTEAIRRWGIGPRTQVVVYDNHGGSMAAARLWVLLRWLGHEDAAVLDGGLGAWQAAGLPLSRAVPRPTHGAFEPRLQPHWIADTDQVRSALIDPHTVLIDARPTEVYRGTQPSEDRVPGHIPGARCLPLQAIQAPDGTLASAQTLVLRYQSLGALDEPVTTRIAYCGGGVWSAQHVLAMTHAGIMDARLYIGSWSEWIASGDRPAQTSLAS